MKQNNVTEKQPTVAWRFSAADSKKKVSENAIPSAPQGGPGLSCRQGTRLRLWIY